jgi:hypothetical protein
MCLQHEILSLFYSSSSAHGRLIRDAYHVAATLSVTESHNRSGVLWLSLQEPTLNFGAETAMA